MESLPNSNPKAKIPSKEMANSRTYSKKRARTDVLEQDNVDDNVDNAMAVIRKTILAKSSKIGSLEARLEQMSSESNAAMSRFQQLSDDNAVLQKDNEYQVKKIEKYHFRLSSIRKEMEESISRADERCKQLSFSNTKKDLLIAWYQDEIQSLLVDKDSSIVRAEELHQQLAERWDNRAELRELAEVNVKKLVGK
ncbi:hypothetical protein EAE96_002599 [Botrytis aclada]|nr:hypothetical protein EAE96_002599 [Botrytis aclada]